MLFLIETGNTSTFGGFGASPSFGGSPAFGGTPSFGGQPSFGASPAFGGASSPPANQSVFGQQAPSPAAQTSIFGGASAGAQSGFAQLANTGTGAFGQSGSSPSVPSFTQYRG